MSKEYKRARNLYDPQDPKPYKLSRSKIELFIECPRCFYIDRRLGIGRPPGYPFTLNSAVDNLLKNEFDLYRTVNKPHPIITEYGIDAYPVNHPSLDTWRHNFSGVQFLHEKTNLLIFGAIDDLWIDSSREHIVVDYKATSKNEKITELNKDWQIVYKRQMEIYQWLLRNNDLQVSDTGYFVYCNGQRNKDALDGRLEFEINLVSYTGSDGWLEDVILRLHSVLLSKEIPEGTEGCKYCGYTTSVADILNGI